MRTGFSYVCLVILLYGPEPLRRFVCRRTSILLDLRRVLLQYGDHEAATAALVEWRKLNPHR